MTDTVDQRSDLELDLAAIGARADAATRGPWHVEPGLTGYPQRICNHAAAIVGETFTGPEHPPADADFIAAARTDVPALLAEVARLHGALGRVHAVVRKQLAGVSAYDPHCEAADALAWVLQRIDEERPSATAPAAIPPALPVAITHQLAEEFARRRHGDDFLDGLGRAVLVANAAEWLRLAQQLLAEQHQPAPGEPDEVGR